MHIATIMKPADARHVGMVDLVASMTAMEEARLLNEYVLLHIRAKPSWLPEIAWKWLLGKLLVLNRFNKK